MSNDASHKPIQQSLEKSQIPPYDMGRMWLGEHANHFTSAAVYTWVSIGRLLHHNEAKLPPLIIYTSFLNEVLPHILREKY